MPKKNRDEGVPIERSSGIPISDPLEPNTLTDEGEVKAHSLRTGSNAMHDGGGEDGTPWSATDVGGPPDEIVSRETVDLKKESREGDVNNPLRVPKRVFFFFFLCF